MSLRTPLGRVLGKGSAGEGTGQQSSGGQRPGQTASGALRTVRGAALVGMKVAHN